MSPVNSPLVVILGETATGKSRLAIEVARILDGEIICADSWTVRKGLDIGTDKPTKSEQNKTKHYLIDLVEPDEPFTVVDFKRLANEAIADIYSRGKLPIIVGGTGLYIDSVVFDYGFLDDSDPKQREYLNTLGVDDLLDTISQQNLPINESVDRRNKRRLIRLIESGGRIPVKEGLRPNTIIIGLTMNPEMQTHSIEGRVDKMISEGLEQEVRQLSDRFGWQCEALKGVGYKQWQRYIDGTQSIDETRQQIISATNNLAKKQRTWFKRNKSIHWLSQPVSLDKVVELITTNISI